MIFFILYTNKEVYHYCDLPLFKNNVSPWKERSKDENERELQLEMQKTKEATERELHVRSRAVS